MKICLTTFISSIHENDPVGRECTDSILFREREKKNPLKWVSGYNMKLPACPSSEDNWSLYSTHYCHWLYI